MKLLVEFETMSSRYFFKIDIGEGTFVITLSQIAPVPKHSRNAFHITSAISSEETFQIDTMLGLFVRL